MKPQRPFSLALGTLLAMATLMALPILAKENDRNATGLPLYPNATTGTQYPAAETNGRWYAIYTAESHDSLAVVEAWYRHALPKAKEAKDENQLTHGIVLTTGQDRVLVYQLGKSAGTVIELHKYVR